MTRRPSLGVELVVIAIGGAVGGSLRYGVDQLWPIPATVFPWPTVLINVAGSALLAALLSAGVRAWRHPLELLFAGTGVLGGFTTFASYAVQTHELLASGHRVQAVSYLAVTLGAALLAAWWMRRTVLTWATSNGTGV